MKQPEIKRKPILLKDQVPLGASFSTKVDRMLSPSPLHFHPEIEVVYFQDVKGVNIVGSHVGKIQNGLVVVIGENLPHTRYIDSVYYQHHSSEEPAAIVTRFRKDFIGKDFFAVKEFLHVEILLKKAQRGLVFFGKTSERVGRILRSQVDQTGPPALHQLLIMLDILSNSDECQALNTVNVMTDPNSLDSEKINKVFQFTENNFREAITLAEVASLIDITIPAFCRYFKIRTGKSYFQYLTEYRISNACKMLLEAEKDIAEIGYFNGFNTPSNFHKQFKRIMKLTPKEYRENVRNRN